MQPKQSKKPLVNHFYPNQLSQIKHHEIIRFLISPTINHQKINGRAVLFNLLQ